jgi:hypothetical protein
LLATLNPGCYARQCFFLNEELDADKRILRILASAAIPWGFDPVEIDGRRYVDGGWEDMGGDAYWADPEEAEQIVSDLEAADYEEQFPTDKQYLFKARIDDEQIISIETGKRIAEIYEQDQICGIYGDMEVWDVSGKEPKRISILDLVGPILNQKRWMEQEYRDYCDAVNEYGYDFEGRDE